MTQFYYVYVGSYTRPRTGSTGEGISVLRLNAETAALERISIARELVNPSFLVVTPDHRHLYAVNEANEFGGKIGGALTAFSIDATSGALVALNQQPEPGTGPCYVSLDRSGTWLLAANYQGGSVVVLPILGDGELGAPTSYVQHSGSSVNRSRQSEAHAHSIIVDQSNSFALAADLGMDKIVVYRFDGKRGTLTPHDSPAISIRPGAGPRHMAFHPDGRYLYVANELDSTVSVIAWDPMRGAGEDMYHVSTVPADFSDVNYPAEIQVGQGGRFIYVSNRGHDSIAVFTVEEGGSTLRAAGYISTQGHWPRHFSITPDGRIMLVANEHSDALVAFWIDNATAQLTPSGQMVAVAKPACVCLGSAG